MPTLSVWETLAITTNLRLPQSFSASDKEALMLESLRSMGLLKVKNSQARTPSSSPPSPLEFQHLQKGS